MENILNKDGHKDYFQEAPYPNCFGNLLSPQVVLTTLSCFRKVREVSEYFGEWSLLRRRIVQGVTQETDPTEIIVAKVKFINSEKATKFCEISTIDLTGTT